MSYKPEVKVEGKWEHNGLVFETAAEARASAESLFDRWVLCEDSRAVESSEPVNYVHVAGRDVPVKVD